MESAVNDCIEEYCEEAKAEAIKEFAERLKEVSSHIVDMNLDVIEFVEVRQINDLVKEMVGDAE